MSDLLCVCENSVAVSLSSVGVRMYGIRRWGLLWLSVAEARGLIPGNHMFFFVCFSTYFTNPVVRGLTCNV